MRTRRHSTIAAIAFLCCLGSTVLLLGCDSECVCPGRGRIAIGGIWGGDGIRLDASADIVQLLYDCAEGSIEGPIVPDARGHFEVEGILTPTPGPVTDNGRKSYMVWYRGEVDGTFMRLTVTLAETSELMSGYELEFGDEGEFEFCY